MGDYRSITIGAADCLFAPLFAALFKFLLFMFKEISSGPSMVMIVHKRLGIHGFCVHTPYIKSEQIFQMSRNWRKILVAGRI